MKLNAGGLSSLVIARQTEIKILKTYIALHQHTVLVAPRRYGKTTIVNKVLNDLKDDYLIVKLDVFEASNIKEICYAYINAIYKSVGITNFLYKTKESIFSLLDKFSLAYETEGIKIGYEISKDDDLFSLVEKTFNLAEKFSKLHSKKMIVFIDEFGDIEKFGQDFIKKIRSYMQKHENVIYIFAGSQTSVMNNIFLNNENAFFNLASLMNIDVLEKKESIKFLKDLKIMDKTFNDESIEYLCASTKFHPFYLIKAVQESLIQSLLSQNDNISLENVKKAIDKILDDNNAYFESIWQKINYKKYKCSIFKSYCRNKEDIKKLDMNSSYKSQLTKELKQESILSKELNPTDPFLSLWLRSKDSFF